MRNLVFVQTMLAFFVSGCSTQQPESNDASVPPEAAAEAGAPQCDPSACQSGHCAPDGGCAQGCSSNDSCATNETCCNGTFCSDLSKDPQNCGACGTACSMQQFCSGTSCFDALVMNVCKNASGDIVADGLATDEDAGGTVQGAMTGGCVSISLTTISQGAAGSIDPNSGRPLLGPGTTYVAVGGAFGQKAIAYMNGARNAPVYTTDDQTTVSFFRTSDGSTIVTAPVASLTVHHDFFIVYAAAEPVSGTLVFAVYGLYGSGTAAAAYWLHSQASTLPTFAKQYYVYEWTDTNNNAIADAADTFKLVASN